MNPRLLAYHRSGNSFAKWAQPGIFQSSREYIIRRYNYENKVTRKNNDIKATPRPGTDQLVSLTTRLSPWRSIWNRWISFVNIITYCTSYYHICIWWWSLLMILLRGNATEKRIRPVSSLPVSAVWTSLWTIVEFILLSVPKAFQVAFTQRNITPQVPNYFSVWLRVVERPFFRLNDVNVWIINN